MQKQNNADLIIKSTNDLIMYSCLGSFYDTNDGVYLYQDQFENAANKSDYIKRLNYCEFIYLLFYWKDENNEVFTGLSKDLINNLESFISTDFPELSDIFFEFHWYNKYCQLEDIKWNNDFDTGIGSNGIEFILSIDWHEHNLYVKKGLYQNLIIVLEDIKNELILKQN